MEILSLGIPPPAAPMHDVARGGGGGQCHISVKDIDRHDAYNELKW